MGTISVFKCGLLLVSGLSVAARADEPILSTDGLIHFQSEKQDSLLEVFKAIGKPLAGPEGARVLQETIRLNPFAIHRNGSSLELEDGAQVFIPYRDLPSSSEYRVSKGGELEFSCAKLRRTHCYNSLNSTGPLELKPAASGQPIFKSTARPKQATGEFQKFNIIEIRPINSYLRLDGTNILNQQHAVLISKSAYGLGLKWQQQISPRFATLASLTLSHVDFVAPEAPDPSTPQLISTASKIMAGIEVGLQFKPLSEFTLGLTLGEVQEYHYQARVGAITGLDSVATPRATISSRYAIVHSGLLRLHGKLSAFIMAPVNTRAYRTSVASGYRAAGDLSYVSGTSSYGIGTYYQSQNQSTSELSESRTDLGFELILSFRFGASASK